MSQGHAMPPAQQVVGRGGRLAEHLGAPSALGRAVMECECVEGGGGSGAGREARNPGRGNEGKPGRPFVSGPARRLPQPTETGGQGDGPAIGALVSWPEKKGREEQDGNFPLAPWTIGEGQKKKRNNVEQREGDGAASKGRQLNLQRGILQRWRRRRWGCRYVHTSARQHRRPPITL